MCPGARASVYPDLPALPATFHSTLNLVCAHVQTEGKKSVWYPLHKQRSESTQAACAHLRGGSLRSSGGSCTPWCSGPAGPGSWGGPPSSSTPERSGCPACSARRPGKTTVSLSCVSPSVRTPPCCATWSRRVAQRVPVFILLVHLGHLMVCVLRYHRHHVPPGLCAPRGQVRYGLSHEPPFLTCDKRLEFPQALLERFQGQLRSLSSFLSERSASRPGPRPPPPYTFCWWKEALDSVVGLW